MTKRFGTIAHPPDKKRRLEKRERKRRQLLDGDGLWRRTFGERRTDDRRDGGKDNSAIIHLPFLDELLDEPEKDESIQPSPDNTDVAQVNAKDHNTQTDNKQRANADTNSVSASADQTPKQLSAKEQARLASLRNMLDASNARYEQATKKRSPVFAAGLKVKVTQGDYMGEIGVVLDADYIESRALVSLPDESSPRWIGFRSLGHSE